jgi:tetratricopeptide (TPR) repeat protein
MVPRQPELENGAWDDGYAVDLDDSGNVELKPIIDEFLQSVPKTFTDIDVTPSVDTFREIERNCVAEHRWGDLVRLFVERAASVADAGERTRCLVRAAQIFDTNLADTDRAFVTLLAALREDPADDGLRGELARLATVHNRWDELLVKCDALAVELGPKARAELFVAMAVWHEHDLGDLLAAEKALEAAMAADAGNFTAVRALVLWHGQRGDWHRAAAYLTCAAGNAVDPFDSIELALDAADIYRDQLHDAEAATVQYMRVLTWSPNHPKALAALADAAWKRNDWSAAAPLLEVLAGSAKNAAFESAELWHKAGWSAEMAGNVDRARANYRKAFAISPTHGPTLRDWSHLAGNWGLWQDVLITVPRLLAVDGSNMTGEVRAGHWMQLGIAHMALRDLEEGAAALVEATRLAPELPGLRQALTKVSAEIEGRGSGNAAARIEHYRLLLHGPLSEGERFDLLCKIGRLQREELHDHAAALASYLQAAKLRPHDIGVLHELVEIHTSSRHWSRAVDVLEQLVALTSGRDKSCYLNAMASILGSELDSPMEAVALYDRALDEDPSDRRTFERLERILVERQDWRELARAYRRMIKRVGSNLSTEQRPLLSILWRGLAEICQRRLRDLPAAEAAYEVCVSLAPDDSASREALAEVYEAQGRDGFSMAVVLREQLLASAVKPEAAAKHIRALGHLYGKYQQYDGVYCTSAALCALTKADPSERVFYETTAPKTLTLAKSVLTEKSWQGRLCPSREHHLIGQVMAAVAPGVITARAREASTYGLEPQYRAMLENDSSFVSRLLVYVSHFTGLPLPAVFVPPGAAGEIDLVVLLEDGRPRPALVLGRDLVAGRTRHELAFLLTKKLVGLRADHFLLWPQLVPSLAELEAIFAAAVKLVRPRFELPGAHELVVRKYIAFLKKVLPPTQIELLAATVEPLVTSHSRPDLRAWSAESDAIANRAGLLVCGDVVAAAREIVREARAHHSRPEDVILNLVRFSVSSDFLDLRERLGLAMAVADPVTPPVAHAFAELGGLFERDRQR